MQHSPDTLLNTGLEVPQSSDTVPLPAAADTATIEAYESAGVAGRTESDALPSAAGGVPVNEYGTESDALTEQPTTHPDLDEVPVSVPAVGRPETPPGDAVATPRAPRPVAAGAGSLALKGSPALAKTDNGSGETDGTSDGTDDSTRAATPTERAAEPDNGASNGKPPRKPPVTGGGESGNGGDETGDNEGEAADHDGTEPFPRPEDPVISNDQHEPEESGREGLEPSRTVRERGQVPLPFPEGEEERAAIAGELMGVLRDRAYASLEESGTVPAELFDIRLQLETSELQSALIAGESSYGKTSGDYSGPGFAMRPEHEATRPEDRDHEAFLSTEIARRIEAIDPNNPLPVVVLDIGGGRGTTWSRLAVQHADAVQAGKVAFVVSNLRNGPETYSDRYGWPEDADSAEYQRLLERTQEEGLVHFVNSTFIGLPDVTITLPNGRDIKLEDNVSIMHEVSSMSLWSSIPEVTIPEATWVMAPGGMYMVGGTDVQVDRGYAAQPLGVPRVIGIRNAHTALENRRGLQKTEMPLSGAYGWVILRDSRA
jgi:hypothetical protein